VKQLFLALTSRLQERASASFSFASNRKRILANMHFQTFRVPAKQHLTRCGEYIAKNTFGTGVSNGQSTGSNVRENPDHSRNPAVKNYNFGGCTIRLAVVDNLESINLLKRRMLVYP